MVVVLLAVWMPTEAQTQAQGQQSRERELLRRAQAALRDTAAERDTLRASELALKAALADAGAELDRARAEAAALRGRLQDAEAGRVQLRGTLEAERDQATRSQSTLQAAAAAREAALREELASLRQALDERTLSNRRVSTLLEQATASLRDTEKRNADLHALSLTLIDRWRHKTPAEALLHGETLVGVAGVRAEDQAERWRQQADMLARPAAGR